MVFKNAFSDIQLSTIAINADSTCTSSYFRSIYYQSSFLLYNNTCIKSFRLVLTSQRNPAFIQLQYTFLDQDVSIYIFTYFESKKVILSQFFQRRPLYDLSFIFTQMCEFQPLKEDFIIFARQINNDRRVGLVGDDDIGQRLICLQFQSWFFYLHFLNIKSCINFYNGLILGLHQGTKKTIKIILIFLIHITLITFLFFLIQLWFLRINIQRFSAILKEFLKHLCHYLRFLLPNHPIFKYIVFKQVIIKKMTLRIQLKNISQNNQDQQKRQVHITSKKLINKYFDVGKKYSKNNKQMILECHNEDFLKFHFYESNREPKIEYGRAQFNCKTFLKANKKMLSENDPYEDQIDIKDGELVIAKLWLNIWYDPTILYEGQMNVQAVDLCLHNKQGKITFFQGKCPNTNIFSYFDSPADNHNCQIIQSDYITPRK